MDFMNRNILSAWFRKLVPDSAEARGAESSDLAAGLFTGLVVSPAEFSGQLTNLQLSLLRATADATATQGSDTITANVQGIA